MKVVVASGKGGTGKTSVAVNLALSVGADQVLDCDVEEPNVHIFLKPEATESHPVELLVPRIVEEKCTYCRRCAEFCQYNALFVAGETAMVFPELCHYPVIYSGVYYLVQLYSGFSIVIHLRFNWII